MKPAGLLAWGALGAALWALAAPASAKGKKADDEVTASDDDATASDSDSSDDDAKPAKKKKKPAASDDATADDDADGGARTTTSSNKLKKQDLTGHDLGTTKKENVFERDRFFVDKTDSEKTEKGTLVQGSLTSTSFAYHESGGTFTTGGPAAGPVTSNGTYSRLFTDMRLQTDFRHISNSKWDGRIDVRGRAVVTPSEETYADGPGIPASQATVQSGLLGKNELDIREAWLVRNGSRSDVFLGRQYVPDLGGLKIDGLRIDYASSTKFTLLGFGGLYPIRGSRSITDDYTPLMSNPAADGTRSSAGRFTGAAGFGAAYRTPEAYGSFGGVALAPFSSESPRVYGTSSGYWRYGAKLDFYHFAIVDLVGSNAVNAGLTNLSLGVNYKPDQRLRATASFNRVDTETLDVQAQAFLLSPDPGLNAVQNEAYLQRVATNEARGSLSAGLGELQRFEITAALTYRRRGDLTISGPPQAGGTAPTAIALPAAQSVEVYGGITDRRSIKDLRLGADASQTFGVGSATYQRTKALQLRAFASHELANGHGEWEAEVAYSSTKDDDAGMACGPGAVLTACFGAANASILSVGGNLYYRLNRDWFLLGSAFINRTSVTHIDAAGQTNDPAVLGLTGFFRIAYRF